jgi:spore maturation protein CgeB
LFHDTHHRAVTAPEEMGHFRLDDYDGVLACGEAVRQRYLQEGWADNVATWHEAADTRVFKPLSGVAMQGDLVWIGNWGDEARSRQLREFLIDPVAALNLFACVHGVRYPRAALGQLAEAGIDYRGWLPNHRVPEAFAAFRVTVHVPRLPFVQAVPGVPTIQVFEALACGIPLVCAPWYDTEGLFQRGRDYLVARDGKQMRRHLRDLLHDREMAADLATHGLRTVRSRHTCGHRVQQLLEFLAGFADDLRLHVPAGRQQGRSLHA